MPCTDRMSSFYLIVSFSDFLPLYKPDTLRLKFSLTGHFKTSIYFICTSQSLLHRLLHSIQDILIPCTSAQMSGEQLPKLISRVLFAALENLNRAHDHTRCTESALYRRLIDKSLLNI